MSELRERIASLSPEKRALLEKRLMTKQAPAAGSEAAIPRRRPEDPCLLSCCQQRLWFLDQLSPGTSTYNVPNAMRIRGKLNVEAFRKALQAIVARHEVLRTTYALVNGAPAQVIAGEWSLAVPLIDLRHLRGEAQQAELRRLMEREARRSFNLQRDLMFRPSLLRLGDEEFIFQLLTHHVAWDAWSKAVVYRELGQLYRGCCNCHPARLLDLPIQYADFALWQQRSLQGEAYEELVAYWKQQLAGAPANLELPTDHPRPSVQTFRGNKYLFTGPAELADAAKAVARQEGVTLFMALLAAFEMFLYCYTGHEDISIGSPHAGRTRVETEGLVGFFINTMVLRVNLAGNPTYRELLKRVKEVTLGVYAHPDMPFEKLVEVLRPPRDLSRNALFQVNFRVQTAPSPPLELDGLVITALDLIDTATSKFDLALELSALDGFGGYFEYNTDLFDKPTIVRMCGEFQKLLETVLGNPDTHLHSLELIQEVERRKPVMTNSVGTQPKMKSLRDIKRKAVDLSHGDLVKNSYFRPGQMLPLVLQPAVASLDLAEWAMNNQEFIQTNLNQHGAILFRGFGLGSPADFEKVAAAIYRELYAEYGDLPREGVAGKIYGTTPYPADQTILFHNESSHMSRWPTRISFFCVKAAEQGGETPILDCREVYRKLDPAIRQKFEERGVAYIRNFSPGLDVSWRKFFHTEDRGAVEESCRKAGMTCEWTANDGLRVRQKCQAVAKHPRTGEKIFFNQVQLHHIGCLDPVTRESLLAIFKEEDLPRNVTYGDGTPIEDDVMAYLDDLYWKTCVKFPWQEGDMITLDNMLVAHARSPYAGTRKVVVALGDLITDSELEASRV